MDSDRIKGKGNEVKGEAKERLGRATDDRKLQAEGKVDKTKGEAQQAFGKAKDKMRD